MKISELLAKGNGNKITNKMGEHALKVNKEEEKKEERANKDKVERQQISSLALLLNK